MKVILIWAKNQANARLSGKMTKSQKKPMKEKSKTIRFQVIFFSIFIIKNLIGNGKMTWEDGRSYEGGWLNGKPTGNGKFSWKNGANYIGDYNEEGKKHGDGTLSIPGCGIEYCGEFRQGKMHGRAKVSYSDGRVTHGNWRDGQMFGMDE